MSVAFAASPGNERGKKTTAPTLLCYQRFFFFKKKERAIQPYPNRRGGWEAQNYKKNNYKDIVNQTALSLELQKTQKFSSIINYDKKFYLGIFYNTAVTEGGGLIGCTN